VQTVVDGRPLIEESYTSQQVPKVITGVLSHTESTERLRRFNEFLRLQED